MQSKKLKDKGLGAMVEVADYLAQEFPASKMDLLKSKGYSEIDIRNMKKANMNEFLKKNRKNIASSLFQSNKKIDMLTDNLTRVKKDLNSRNIEMSKYNVRDVTNNIKMVYNNTKHSVQQMFRKPVDINGKKIPLIKAFKGDEGNLLESLLTGKQSGTVESKTAQLEVQKLITKAKDAINSESKLNKVTDRDFVYSMFMNTDDFKLRFRYGKKKFSMLGTLLGKDKNLNLNQRTQVEKQVRDIVEKAIGYDITNAKVRDKAINEMLDMLDARVGAKPFEGQPSATGGLKRYSRWQERYGLQDSVMDGIMKELGAESRGAYKRLQNNSSSSIAMLKSYGDNPMRTLEGFKESVGKTVDLTKVESNEVLSLIDDEVKFLDQETSQVPQARRGTITKAMDALLDSMLTASMPFVGLRTSADMWTSYFDTSLRLNNHDLYKSMQATGKAFKLMFDKEYKEHLKKLTGKEVSLVKAFLEDSMVRHAEIDPNDSIFKKASGVAGIASMMDINNTWGKATSLTSTEVQVKKWFSESYDDIIKSNELVRNIFTSSGIGKKEFEIMSKVIDKNDFLRPDQFMEKLGNMLTKNNEDLFLVDPKDLSTNRAKRYINGMYRSKQKYKFTMDNGRQVATLESKKLMFEDMLDWYRDRGDITTVNSMKAYENDFLKSRVMLDPLVDIDIKYDGNSAIVANNFTHAMDSKIRTRYREATEEFRNSIAKNKLADVINNPEGKASRELADNINKFVKEQLSLEKSDFIDSLRADIKRDLTNSFENLKNRTSEEFMISESRLNTNQANHFLQNNDFGYIINKMANFFKIGGINSVMNHYDRLRFNRAGASAFGDINKMESFQNSIGYFGTAMTIGLMYHAFFSTMEDSAEAGELDFDTFKEAWSDRPLGQFFDTMMFGTGFGLYQYESKPVRVAGKIGELFQSTDTDDFLEKLTTVGTTAYSNRYIETWIKGLNNTMGGM